MHHDLQKSNSVSTHRRISRGYGVCVCVCVCRYVYMVSIMKYYSAIKKSEILPFATSMDPEDIILSEISQSEKNKYHISFTHMWNLRNKTYEQKKQIQTDRQKTRP